MKYNRPRGTVDITPENSEKWIEMEQLLRTVAANYNVKEMRTPIFEHTELFSRAVGDTTDVVTKEMYTFKDKGDRSLTLRPEGTAGIARAYVENKMYALPEKLQKVYYMGPMFRYERPQNGRQRQFHQFGVEMLGVESPYVDVECMLMAVTIVEALGIKNIKLHINSLGDDESRTAYREALKNHFRPEFLNRLDEIIMFKPLTKDNISKIINLLVADVNKRLADKELEIVLTDAAKDFIVENGFDPMYGARPLKRYVQKTVETLAAKLILAGNINTGDDIVIDLVDGKLTARAAARAVQG